MGQLIVTEYLTLDGVAQAPGGPDEDRDGGFAYGGWQAPFVDEDSVAVVFEQARTMDALLLGRRTYDIFADFWPNAPEEIPFTNLLNGVPKYVASNSLSSPLEWNGSTVVKGDFVEAITAIKAQHAEVHVIGSLNLVQSLLQYGLIDRLNVWLSPLVLGTGKRLFAGGTVPTSLRLSESATYPSGVMGLVYEFEGTPTFGTVADPS